MPGFARVLAVAVVLLFPHLASAFGGDYAPPLSFDLVACQSATHIVVTDSDGRALESWRGDLQPGRRIALGPEGLTPLHALPWKLHRLRPDSASGWYHPASLFPERGPGGGVKRLVLFLRREGEAGAGEVWMPAVVPETHDGGLWQPFSQRKFRIGLSWRRYLSPEVVDIWAANVAWIEDGQVLAAQARAENRGNKPDLVRIATSVDGFKCRVLMPPATWPTTLTAGEEFLARVIATPSDEPGNRDR